MTRSTDIQHDIRLVDYRVAIRDCRTDLYLRFVGKPASTPAPMFDIRAASFLMSARISATRLHRLVAHAANRRG
jgi:hypothetical protein